MAEKEQEKVKGFRLTSSEQKIVNDLIVQSGRDPLKESTEWFREVLNQLQIQELTLEKDGIPSSLRKSFSSDITALKDATNLITTTFINQMNRVSVQKKEWDNTLQITQDNHKEKLQEKDTRISDLEAQVIGIQQELESEQNQIVQLLAKIEGFEKLEKHLTKERDGLLDDKAKISNEKELLQIEFKEVKELHKEEKNELNGKIVDIMDELKKTEPIRTENEKLKSQLKTLEASLTANSRQYEINLTRQQEQAEVDKEKSLLARERELYEQYRQDTKELYEKIERLQADNQVLNLKIAKQNSNKEENQTP
ncbi:hypothetical protein [Cytobacillus gottheilii]|uniref:hypothetical protein n=1 Tax=Cytobacillus gottheilii TaxID=859144 RepID=UPI0024941F62|nr:hypothetical protein [Cytobacillus gottheilii]